MGSHSTFQDRPSSRQTLDQTRPFTSRQVDQQPIWSERKCAGLQADVWVQQWLVLEAALEEEFEEFLEQPAGSLRLLPGDPPENYKMFLTA